MNFIDSILKSIRFSSIQLTFAMNLFEILHFEHFKFDSIEIRLYNIE